MPRLTQAERREATRSAILKAAAERMVRHGLAGTTLDDVADDAGVTKGALYHYFANKDALIVGVIGAMATVDPVADRRSALPAKRRAAAAKRASAGLLSPELQAFNYELYAASIRNPAIRDALGARTRAALAEIVEAQQSSRDFVVAAAALVEGLSIRKMLNPELVPDALFQRALDALAAMRRERS